MQFLTSHGRCHDTHGLSDRKLQRTRKGERIDRMEDQLREGLKRLDSYVKELDFQSTLLEKSAVVPMDCLLIPLRVGEDLSIDISCNFVDVPEAGNLLQFYGQLSLNEMLAEASAPVSDYDIMNLINELNSMLPVGQFLYLRNEEQGRETQKALGIRYTMLTGLNDEKELDKCGRVLMLLMQVYELLGSSLILLMNGNSVEETLDTLRQILNV